MPNLRAYVGLLLVGCVVASGCQSRQTNQMEGISGNTFQLERDAYLVRSDGDIPLRLAAPDAISDLPDRINDFESATGAARDRYDKMCVAIIRRGQRVSVEGWRYVSGPVSGTYVEVVGTLEGGEHVGKRVVLDGLFWTAPDERRFASDALESYRESRRWPPEWTPRREFLTRCDDQ